MGHVTIKFKDQQNQPQELVWQEGFVLNEATSAGVVSITDNDNEEIVIRTFDEQSEAEDFHLWLSGRIHEGLGNGTIVIDTDDF